MADKHINVGNVLSQAELFKQNSHRLQLESFKIDTYLNLMNNCADRCNLQYKETGLKEVEGAEDVSCFNTCLSKTHAINKLIDQWVEILFPPGNTRSKNALFFQYLSFSFNRG